MYVFTAQSVDYMYTAVYLTNIVFNSVAAPSRNVIMSHITIGEKLMQHNYRIEKLITQGKKNYIAQNRHTLHYNLQKSIASPLPLCNQCNQAMVPVLPIAIV